MARLFQPTFKSSSIATPNVGGDVGALGDYVMKTRLAEAEQRRLDLANKRAEEEAAWKRADRAQLEATRDFLRGFNYDPTTDSSVINRTAFEALNRDVTDRNTQILKEAGVMDARGNFTGKDVTPEVRQRLEALGADEQAARSRIPVTQESVYDSVFTQALKATGDQATAANLAKVTASRFKSRDDILKAEQTAVKNYNEAIDRRQDLLFKQAQLNKRSGKSGSSDKGKYAQNYDVLQGTDYDLSLVDSFGIGDAGKVSDIIESGRQQKVEPWAIDKAIRNSIERSGSGDSLIGSRDSIVDLAKFYQSGKTNQSDVPILERAKARSFDEIMGAAGDLALDRREGSSVPTRRLPTGGNTPTRVPASGSTGNAGGLRSIFSGGTPTRTTPVTRTTAPEEAPQDAAVVLDTPTTEVRPTVQAPVVNRPIAAERLQGLGNTSNIGDIGTIIDRVLFPNRYRELPPEALEDSVYGGVVEDTLNRPNIDPIRSMIDFGGTMRRNIPEPTRAAIEAIRGLPDAITEGNRDNFAVRDIMSRIAQNKPVSDAELFEVYRLLSPELRAKAETQIPIL